MIGRTQLAIAVSSGILLASAGCTAGAGRTPGAEQGATPTVQTSVTPTRRTAGVAPASPSSITARPAELPSVVVQQPIPSRLVVRAAGIDLPVAAMGVAADGQMALPPNPKTIGWYRFGAGPGDGAGSVVLGGHLDSREYGVGPLVRLRKLREGDLLEVRRTDGVAVRYRVSEIRDIPKAKLAIDDLFDRAGPSHLRVVTCGGPYDADDGGYRDNLVVTADPLP